MRALRFGGMAAVFFIFTTGTALALPPDTPVAKTSSTNDRIRTIVKTARSTFVGGDFTRVQGKRKHYVARLSSKGRYAARWRARTNGRVYALALSGDGSRLFVAGAFTKVNGARRPHLAAVSAATGRLVRSWRAGTNGTVRALAIRRGWLYLGGDFTRVRGKHRVRLAALIPASGRVRRWHPLANRAVRALAFARRGTRLLAGGDFNKVAGPKGRRRARANFVSFHSRTGKLMGFNPAPGHPVNVIRTVGRTMYLGTGGDACGTGGNCNALLAYSTTTAALRWRCQSSGDVNALARSGPVLYVGGHWQQLVRCRNMRGNNRVRLMALNRANGRVLAGWSPGSGGFGVLALAARGSRLSVGGDFHRISGKNRGNYAQFRGNLSSRT
jgi:hypothetical protein